jgi:serine O-acetyltransferase
MLNLFLEIAMYFCGGFWKFKERIRLSRQKHIRRILLFLYYLYLRSSGGYVGHSSILNGEPCLPHGLKGVFISGGSRIGVNCVIFQNVTIGSNPLPFSGPSGFPEIGDNCYIGAGATIIGGVKIGNNVRIGANCSVFSDIPPNSVVVSMPPRVIAREDLINKYYKWSSKGPLYYDNGKWVLETDQEIIGALRNKL